MILPRLHLVILLFALKAPAFALAEDDGSAPASATPRVLLLGDSISIGYTPYVQEMLTGEAVVIRPMRNATQPENCSGTTDGAKHVDRWLAIDGGGWSVIHFNFGLHDLKRVDPNTGAPSSSADHPRQADPEQYEKNLREIVGKLKKTGAKLIFATTTPVPEGGVRPHRDVEDPDRYNNIARKVMAENGVAVNDLYAFALPRLKEIQRPVNVHFTPEGSKLLAEQVVKHVREALESSKQPDAGGAWRRSGVRQVVAHRGSSADRPENTLAALRRAIEAGATAVEIDVRTTKDGYLVLLHDATLDRTTNGAGPLRETTLAEVRALDAGSWFDAKYRGERVPTLPEALAECRGKIDVLLDFKEQGDEFAAAVAQEVQKHGDPERTILGVRSVEQAKQFRRLLLDARQLGLIAEPGDVEPYAAVGVETIRLWPKWLADERLVRRVRESGPMLHLNGTTGTPEEIRPLLEHRPDSLSSDDPARLIGTLAQLHSAH